MRIARLFVAVVTFAAGAGCTAVPYTPSRALVDSLPRKMAEAQIQSVAVGMDEIMQDDAGRSVSFRDGGFTFRNAQIRGMSLEVAYRRAEWGSYVVGNAAYVTLRNVHRILSHDQPEDGRHFIDTSFWVFVLMRENEEELLKTLDALTSLGIKKAPD